MKGEIMTDKIKCLRIITEDEEERLLPVDRIERVLFYDKDRRINIYLNNRDFRIEEKRPEDYERIKLHIKSVYDIVDTEAPYVESPIIVDGIITEEMAEELRELTGKNKVVPAIMEDINSLKETKEVNQNEKDSKYPCTMVNQHGVNVDFTSKKKGIIVTPRDSSYGQKYVFNKHDEWVIKKG